VDDAKVHTGHPARVQVVDVDGYGGGDRQPQSPTLGQQRHGPDLLRLIRERAGQPHPELGLASGDRQPHPLALDREGAVVVAEWDQTALTSRETSRLPRLVALGGLEPGIGIPLQHRPRTHDGQLAEGSHLRQLAAQRLVAGDRLLPLLVALAVAVQQPCPHVPGRP
jgi:hypothetical protein